MDQLSPICTFFPLKLFEQLKEIPFALLCCFKHFSNMVLYSSNKQCNRFHRWQSQNLLEMANLLSCHSEWSRLKLEI